MKKQDSVCKGWKEKSKTEDLEERKRSNIREPRCFIVESNFSLRIVFRYCAFRYLLFISISPSAELSMKEANGMGAKKEEKEEQELEDDAYLLRSRKTRSS